MNYFHDGSAPGTGAENVVWDLSDLYISTTDSHFVNDLTMIGEDAVVFEERWKNRLAHLVDDEFLMMLQEFDHLMQTMGKLGSRVRLEWSTDSENQGLSAIMQNVSEKLTNARNHTVFVSIELRTMPDEQFTLLLASPLLAHYKHWLEFNRSFRVHTLSEAEEILEAEMDLVGSSAWTRFFDQSHAAMRFSFRGEMVSQHVLMQHLQGSDRALRQEASESMTIGLKQTSMSNSFVFNMMLADCMLSDRRRHYPEWSSARNRSNKISDESVNALVSSVESQYILAERYYNLKKAMLGLETMHEWDRAAPSTLKSRQWSWDDARTIVCTAYHDFDSSIGAIVDEFFDKNWIHAAVKKGKQGGAYAASTVPSVHPYIFINFQGSPRDVKTLAHELGHGVHQYLSRSQGYFNSGTPLTIAETASVFGEMLCFDAMMKQITNEEDKLTLLMEKLSDITNTVFRQISFNRFEHALHTARRHEGELTTQRINDIWMQTQAPSYGSSVTLTDNYQWWWGNIPHFIHTPGYVYAYAFGELLVLALYEIYKEDDTSFKDKYIALLSAGGSDSPENLLKPFSIDLNDEKFWNRGLQYIETLLTQAEELATKLGVRHS